MRKSIAGILAFVLLANGMSRAEETLQSWAFELDTPKGQYRFLNRIFSGMGAASAGRLDKNSGMTFFPTNGSWARLGSDIVWDDASFPYVVLSAMMTHDPAKPPINTTTYLFRNITQKPLPLSAGYAVYERAHKIVLPKLKKTFVLLVNSSGERGGSAVLLEIDKTSHPRTVWKSPMTLRKFQIAFNDLDGKEEKLIFRSTSGSNITYSGFRWSGGRFETDSFIFESSLKAIPYSSFQYGTTD